MQKVLNNDEIYNIPKNNMICIFTETFSAYSLLPNEYEYTFEGEKYKYNLTFDITETDEGKNYSLILNTCGTPIIFESKLINNLIILRRMEPIYYELVNITLSNIKKRYLYQNVK